MCYYMQHIENFQYIFLINKRQCKKAILPSTLPFPLCNAHKLYFDVVSKLLPYVALAFPLFFYYFFAVCMLRGRYVVGCDAASAFEARFSARMR